MFLAEVTRNDHAQRIAVPVRQRNAVHFVGEQRRRLHRFLQWNGVGVIIYAVEAHARGAGKWCSLIKQIAQRNTFPDSVTD